MMLRKKRLITVFVLMFLMLVAYQNCGRGGDGAFGSAIKLDSIPFPVKAESNYLAYMSCSDQSGSISNNYFSFKVNSDNDNGSGLRMTDSFYTLYARNDDQNAILKALRNSKKINTARLQLSILDAKNVTSDVIFATPNDGGAGRYLSSEIAYIDNDSIWTPFSTVGKDNPLAGFKVKGSLDVRAFSRSQLNNNFIANFNNDSFALGINFSSESGDIGQYVRNSAEYGDFGSGVYGTALRLRFNNEELTVVDEFESKSSSVIGLGERNSRNWTCLPAFKIVRPGDESLSGCNNFVNLNASSTFKPEKSLYNILGSNFKVDFNSRCVMNTTNEKSCYVKSLSGGDIPIAYKGEACNNGSVLCPHKLSVCYRN